MPIKEFEYGDNLNIINRDLTDIDHAKVGDNCTIHSFVTIKQGVVIGNNVTIYDHVSILENVIVEDDVIINSGCTIIKGMRLEAGSVIEPGSVITKDVPAGMRAYTMGRRFNKKARRETDGDHIKR